MLTLRLPWGCPPLREYTSATGDSGVLTPLNQLSQKVDLPKFSSSAACLLQPGIGGCNFEQPLSAVLTAFKKLEGSSLMRKNALTVIILITDEEDCSIESDAFFDLKELSDTEANVACGRHKDLLYDIDDLHEKIVNAKTAATGRVADQTILFAAITGVPVASPCEGRGDQIGECSNVRPLVNATGTMAAPDEVKRPVSSFQMQTYYEYACQREVDDEAITNAYPASRIVEMAQKFGKNGFVFSICNENWTPIMKQLGDAILTRVDKGSN
ncbi:MAG: hypothetical protein JXR76_20750 [Deltaproteobacteria bacterium]|nr:hypothetical protein [Deltaproteobacteria bacterium]